MPGATRGPVLVIGYGNTLRRDDGVGVRVAELLAADPRLQRPGVEVRAAHQLLPEMALDLASCALAVFIDADRRAQPGAVEVRHLGRGDPPRSGAGARPEPGASSHHVGAAELVALAAELTGHRPAAVVVGIGVGDTELGEGLSPAVEAVLPRVVDVVAGLVRDRVRGLSG